ncbi:MAG: hypothetical protein Fur0021_36450 [Candidatus Promineifilaceae bacterium]
MKRARPFVRIGLLTLVLAFLIVKMAGAASSTNTISYQPLTTDSLAAPGRIVVKVSPAIAQAWRANQELSALTSTPGSMASLLRHYQVEGVVPAFTTLEDTPLTRKHGLDRIFVLHVPLDTDVWRMAADFNLNPLVEYAEPVYLAQAMQTPNLIPNDPLLPGDYAPFQVKLPQAWDLSTGHPLLRIAMLDTGVDYNHPDLAGNTNTAIDYDFVDMDNDAMDGDGHGTGTASVAGAVTNNALGMAGTCWNCDLIPIRVGGESIIPGLPPVIHFGSLEVAQGIEYAATLQARVINMSLGGQCSYLWADTVNFAYDAGSTLVAAAGNIVPFVVHPAKFERVIAVSATNSDGEFDTFSSYGPELDLAAPGIDIRYATPGGGYGIGSGTSYAAPRVAGTIALMVARNPDLTNAEIRQILRNTAVDLGDEGFDIYYGFGLLDAFATVEQALTPPDEIYNPPEAVCGCLLEEVVPSTPANQGRLDTLRRFRDEILQTSPYGQQLTELYYRHSAQVAGLLFHDPRLAKQLLDLLAGGEPLITSLLNQDGQAKLSRDLIVKTDTFVHILASRANPELRQDLLQAWDRLDLWSFVGKTAHDLQMSVSQLR